jgi:sec-independent protein translocase protein TatA
MFGIGWQEIVVIVLVVLLLFGARRIPELMRSLGRGVREFKDGMKDIEKEVKDDSKQDPPEKQH